MKRSNGKPYRKPDSEAQGECDCISDKYAIDFKLFTSQSRMYTAKIFSPSIEVTDDWISYGMPEKHEGIPGYKKEKYSIRRIRDMIAIVNENMEEVDE